MVKVIEDLKLSYHDVLIRPQRSNLKSRAEVDLRRTFTTPHSKQTFTVVPIIAANMAATGVFETAHVLARSHMMTAIHKHYSLEEWHAFAESCAATGVDTLDYICVSAGSSEADFEKTEHILTMIPQIRFICLDVANGYQEAFVQCVKRYRQRWPDKVIIAGNIVTQELVFALSSPDVGADILKVGIGPGSVCTTRRETGVGYPQLSACLECMEAAKEMAPGLEDCRPLIIGDGGLTVAGDVAKCLAVADFAMIGGMFAGHDESGGDLISETRPDGSTTLFKTFYGMSSAEAMAKFNGGLDKARYRAAEGKSVKIPYRGPLEATVLHMLGGLRSAHTYVGAACMEQFADKVVFVRTTMQTNDVYGQVKQ